MKCYYDSTQDAVALCRACGRGLSHDHLTEVSRGVACKNRCEEDAEVVNRMMANAASTSVATNQILRKSQSAAYGSAIFFAAAGALFTAMSDRPLTLILGIVFIGYSVWTLFRARQHSQLVAAIPIEKV